MKGLEGLKVVELTSYVAGACLPSNTSRDGCDGV